MPESRMKSFEEFWPFYATFRLRPGAERRDMRSHAERGNEK